MKKYDEKSLKHTKQLRQNMTDCEKKLWYYLRAKRFLGLKFKRQVPIGNYIIDFLCVDKKFIIELDGSGHFEKEQMEYDIKRDEYIKNKGYKIIRILDNELNNIESVLGFMLQLI